MAFSAVSRSRTYLRSSLFRPISTATVTTVVSKREPAGDQQVTQYVTALRLDACVLLRHHAIHDASHPIHRRRRALGAGHVGGAVRSRLRTAADRRLQATDGRRGEALQVGDICLPRRHCRRSACAASSSSLRQLRIAT